MIFYGHTHEYRFAELTMKSKKKKLMVLKLLVAYSKDMHTTRDQRSDLSV